jgi:hypothetical protein
MGPGFFGASVRLLEPAALGVGLGPCLYECDGAILATDVELRTGGHDRTFAHRWVAPGDASGFEFHAEEFCGYRTIHEPLDEHHSTVMVLEVF